MCLSLSKDAHYCSRLHWRHLGIGMCKSGTHNIGSTEDKSDGTLVHLLLRQEEGIHVEKLQSRAPRFIVVSEENQFACTVDQQLDVVVALNHLKLIFLWQEVVDVVFDVGIGFQDGVSYAFLHRGLQLCNT